MRREGVTVLLAEQNLHFATLVADAAVVIESGVVVWSGSMDALRADAGARARYLQL
jgi:branched-chain amino acid transport system ATP-binding protein